MWIKSYSIVLLYLICNQWSLCKGNPMKGEAVKFARPDEFPFIVSISTKNYSHRRKVEQDHFCGGALITARHVLTAAHCITNWDNLCDMVVKVGSRDLRSSKMQKYGIKYFVTYEEWMLANNQIPEHPTNDIAVLELSGQVDAKITPAVIATSPVEDFYGKTAETAGWGTKEMEIEPRRMRTATLRVISYQDCIYNVLEHNPSMITEMFESVCLCTVSDPPITLGCGDSGSPLLINKTEIIAVNHGTCYPPGKNKTSPAYQNVHVSIEIYRDFIKDVTSTATRKKSRWWCCGSTED